MTAVDGMDDEIKELVERYTSIRDKLIDWRRDNFPVRSVVYVECDQYTGFGIVERDGAEPHQLAVRLENGNTWWYPVEKTMLAHRPGDWPSWIKREKKLKL